MVSNSMSWMCKNSCLFDYNPAETVAKENDWSRHALVSLVCEPISVYEIGPPDLAYFQVRSAHFDHLEKISSQFFYGKQ